MTSLVQHHTAIRIHNSDINNMMTLPVRLNGLQLPLHPRQLLAILYVLVSLSVFLTLHMSVIASMTIRTTLYVWSVSCAVLLSVLSMALMWSDPVDRSLYTESYHHNVVLTETPSSESKIQTPAVPQHGNRVQQYYRLGLDYKPDPFQSAKPTNDMPTHDPSLQFCTWITGVDAVFSLIVTVYLAYLISLHMYLFYNRTLLSCSLDTVLTILQKVYPTVESNDNVLPK
ncbi:hypothetical protein BATDEDRAFT_26854 [Batrachochytrium dendrobatidis JAM81]|uniref:Uncharacterized protein n=1 Tax=Batrachochytrium dendrobatidis (strain JAM81 / FGSC 10211) TaxID=684364 RepID=F4P965_BATDJ|nr:uncharacterized protein BATDEDRAFT_26854 [Batrachochytrium dendrobatidis JAM81]EGF78288.1 hypothetical protein BATDEDRAFT_26854 [Batrachochytrium dendrobatidis JAM81]|eukprot:XP_006681070.1 hypothetical protein BATDEDRAFT_26854 [Batrachochytrium dendrobatidis JAM81]